MIKAVLCALAGFALIGYGVHCYVERIQRTAKPRDPGHVHTQHSGITYGMRTPCYTVKGQKGVNGGGDGGDATICGSGVATGGAGGGQP